MNSVNIEYIYTYNIMLIVHYRSVPLYFVNSHL